MTAHDELRQAVARAILDSARSMKQDIPSWDDAAKWRHPETGKTMQEAAFAEADAALAAVRAALEVPSNAMIYAGVLALSRSGVDDPNDIDAFDCWLAQLAASPLADPGARDDGAGVG